LDTKTGNEIMELINELHSKKGKTILMVSHERDIAENAERIVNLRDGVIINNEILKKKK